MNYAAVVLACFGFLGWIYLALFHGWFWRIFLAEPAAEPDLWPSVDIIIPARNEAEILPQTLPSLLAQDYPGTWRVILVDDHSNDGTRTVAQKIAGERSSTENFAVITAPDLPEGWSGKVAAMQASVTHSTADYILFTDADITHPTNSLRELISRAIDKKLDLTSLMVKLHCETTVENLLIPAFVFFFTMLYPFRRANNSRSRCAAAAGGVMLVRRKALDNIGGLKTIKSALIDDCALAAAIKTRGGDYNTAGHIELSLTYDVKSLRVYKDVTDVWQMVARTAFTQLDYSPFLLLGTVLGMSILFLVPILLPTGSGPLATALAMVTSLIMISLYVPMVRFYGLPFIWAITLPVSAVIYIGATIDSARLYWQNKGGQWKGRTLA